MDLFLLLGLIVLVLVLMFFGRLVSVALKVLFYALLVLLVFVFIFGVSYNELWDRISAIVLWVI